MTTYIHSIPFACETYQIMFMWLICDDDTYKMIISIMRKMQTHLYKHTKKMKRKEKWERGREE